jgi:hypothetical protein
MRAGDGRTFALSAVVIGVAVLSAACWFPYDIDGDGRADLVYESAQTMQWKHVGSPDVIRTGAGAPAMGNYDGQGNWELAEVSPDTGIWSTAGSRGNISFPPPPYTNTPGISGAPIFAVPARYDGNSTTEPAWFRPSDATWFIEGHDPIQFGTPIDPTKPWEDVPVPGDYNGDGIDELAVYHPPDGTFHIQGDPDPIQVGSIGDLPAPADYDGNGKTVPATISVAADGVTTWHIVGHADTVYPATPVNPSSQPNFVVPAPANYDGQGGADLAVVDVDESTNHSTWRISTAGDIDLGPANTNDGYELGGPAMFNDTELVLMEVDVTRYCSTHTC